MKIYELNYLVPSTIKAEDMQQRALKIESLIQDNQGILTQERKKEKVKLAYPIEDQTEALLFTLRFQIDPRKVNVIRQALRSMPELMRFMVEKTEKPFRKKRRKRPKKGLVSEKQKRKEKAGKEKTKVELEKIEEKLDQILDES